MCSELPTTWFPKGEGVGGGKRPFEGGVRVNDRIGISLTRKLYNPFKVIEIFDVLHKNQSILYVISRLGCYFSYFLAFYSL